MSDPCFTLEDVAKHNGIGDARTWLIIKNVVYDVTNYLDEHPGGGELLSEYAGRDATSAFDDYGHSSDAKSILKSYKIGQLDEKDKSANKVKSNSTKKKATDSKATTTEARKNRRSILRIMCGGCV